MRGVAGTPKEANNLGALRLLFAMLVILSHASELIDGNRSREILTQFFGSLSFGEVGVDGFFLISGYLITQSYQNAASPREYLIKRALRIYPAYAVAYLLCIFAVGPLAGGNLVTLAPSRFLLDGLVLQPPYMKDVFAGLPYPNLNGAMWTIAYEARCYLLVLVCGMLSFERRIVLVVSLAAVYAVLLAAGIKVGGRLQAIVGDPEATLKFSLIFGCGSLFYLCRSHIRYGAGWAGVAAVALAALMTAPVHVASAAFAVFGGYIIFWFAFAVRSPTVASIGSTIDLSYGTYLYGWPIAMLLTSWQSGASPWLLFAETLAASLLIALFSWSWIEAPCLALKTRLVRPMPAQ